MAARSPKVACIVLNWNGWQDTDHCLSALAAVDYPNLSVIVVDNGSTDGSPAKIRAAHPGVPLLESGGNLGFAGGNNIGIRHALAQQFDYVWLLNNDTEPRPGALAALVQKAEADPKLGAIGTALFYVHDPRTVQAWGGGKINHWLGYASHATGPEPDSWFDYITFASVLLRRVALEKVGLLDESFFMYWEDGDLSFRLRKGGWRLGVAQDSVVLHKESASSRGNRRVIDRYSTASGIRFLRKHSPVPWISIPLFIAMRIARRTLRGDLSHISDVSAGVRDYWTGRSPADT